MLLNIQSFNLVDAFLLLILFFCVWGGWKKGFMLGMVGLVKWIVSLLVAFAGYKYAAALIEKITASLGVWLYPISFLVVLLFTDLLLSIITRFLFKSIPGHSHATITNKVLGIIPGFVNGLVYVIVVTALLLTLPLFDRLSDKTRSSLIASRLSDKIEWIDAKLSPVFDDAIKKTMSRLIVEPGSDKIVKLRFTVKSPKVRPDLEEKMLALVNEERLEEGLQPLKPDPEMTAVARAHSADMFARGYFSHYTPEGKDPSDRIRAAGVRFIIAGENLALGQTLNICHTGLMKSPGHRANILRASYGRLGIGVLDGGMYGLMISQEFRN